MLANVRLFVFLAIVPLAAGCAGPDLTKQNFPRTTVTASAQAGGPINDAAVTLPALRTIDPCGLIDSATLADLGAAERPATSDPDACTNVVRDAGGKRLQINLRLGGIVIDPRKASGTVEGLPLIVEKAGDSHCDVTAVISRSPGLGIAAGIDYSGGDACGAGRTVLQKVLRKIHAGPPRLATPAGSALAVDLCAVPDASVTTEVLGRGSESSAAGLHRCEWSGGAANGYLSLQQTGIPGEDDGVPVNLGGVTGYRKLEVRAGKRCTISWLQRATQDGEGEVISVEYDNYHDDAAKDDACGKALKIVRSALPKLPKA
ncbi:MAG TPA: DUF3558 domain-containing protein [Amycolatopsis sp.]|uniref:DUF3558 domain-containing protein n=1 Tax=Amycolatopsis sp. TaxID=37632 RepID=UPI002B4A99A8|nr:DUF3558 domain-containing protein [Amycolatopsis sp.]HKS45814.1 DUF3558 domain-containing protein [Amycolatopsis sp.]